MSIKEIENAILQTIEEVYNKKYIGKLFITRLDPIGLSVKFGMNNVDKPIVISAQLDDVSYLKFLRQELRDRGLHTVQYFLGVKSYPDNCNNPINKSCACNETT